MREVIKPEGVDAEVWNQLGDLEQALALKVRGSAAVPSSMTFDDQLARLDEGLTRTTPKTMEEFYDAFEQEPLVSEPKPSVPPSASSAVALTSSAESAVSSVEGVVDAFVRLEQQLQALDRWCGDLLNPDEPAPHDPTPPSDIVPF